VIYTGWLTDGVEFDSSVPTGKPAEFAVNQVIVGWQEALQRMAPGTRCKLVIPAQLAYRDAGFPPKIGPGATLVFDVELVGVLTRYPRFRAANPEAPKVDVNGVKVEVLRPGTGDPVDANLAFAWRYAFWKPSGTLLDCSEQRNNARISGMLTTMPLPFLKDLAQGRCKGALLRAEVPQSMFPNAGSDTVWELELVHVGPLPPFRAPDKAKAVTTDSGLVYELLAAGEGTSPTKDDTVVAHYSGWLEDGTFFDSSHARGEPTEFPLKHVVAGWTEGLQLLKPGGKVLLRIPSKLGYGERGMPPAIPPNATLVFEIELVEVKKR
jgi:FKBP-type peptidyl-prolyl cis-trans isomerase